MGVNILLRNGIKTIIVTKEISRITKKWATDMNITEIIGGAIRKEIILSKIEKKYKVSSDEIAFIGDDVNDIELLQKVGFSATPADGADETKKVVDYICEKSGGKAAFRETADLILKIQNPKKTNWY